MSCIQKYSFVMAKRHSRVRKSRENERLKPKTSRTAITSSAGGNSRTKADPIAEQLLTDLPSFYDLFPMRDGLQDGIKFLFFKGFDVATSDVDIKNSVQDFIKYFIRANRSYLEYRLRVQCMKKNTLGNPEVEKWCTTKLESLKVIIKCAESVYSKAITSIQKLVSRIWKRTSGCAFERVRAEQKFFAKAEFVRPMNERDDFYYYCFMKENEIATVVFDTVVVDLKNDNFFDESENEEAVKELKALSSSLFDLQKNVYSLLQNSKSTKETSCACESVICKEIVSEKSSYEELLIEKCLEHPENDFAVLVKDELNVLDYIFIDPFKCYSIIVWSLVMNAGKETNTEAYSEFKKYLLYCRRSRGFTSKEASPLTLQRLKARRKYNIDQAHIHLARVHELLYPEKIVKIMEDGAA